MRYVVFLLLAALIPSHAFGVAPDAPFFGLWGCDVADIAAEQSATGTTRRLPPIGAFVSYVLPQDPFAQAGLRANDVIYMANETPIKTASDLAAFCAARKAGERVTLLVQRPIVAKRQTSWERKSITAVIARSHVIAALSTRAVTDPFTQTVRVVFVEAAKDDDTGVLRYEYERQRDAEPRPFFSYLTSNRVPSELSISSGKESVTLKLVDIRRQRNGFVACRFDATGINAFFAALEQTGSGKYRFETLNGPFEDDLDADEIAAMIAVRLAMKLEAH